MACSAILPGDPFLGGMLNFADCQAQTIGASGYQALTMPGSAVPAMLGIALTLFVALFGYRMLLGHTPDVRDGVVAIVKIGVVLMLATSWPAFRTLAYDVAMHGPAELAASIGAGSGADLPGAGGGLVPRLQRIDAALVELTELGTGKPDNAEQVAGPSATPQNPQQQAEQLQQFQRAAQKPRWDPEKDAVRVASARTVYLTSTIAAFASVRLIAGLLLALGPLFALFLLFDATRGLFEGWVRGLAGAALGALATAIVLGVQLALMETWLAGVLVQRRADVPTPTVPVELTVMVLVFALVLLAAVIATAKVAAGFRMPDAWRALPARLREVIRVDAATPLPARNQQTIVGTEQRSRAATIADAVATTQRREARLGAVLEPARFGERTGGVAQAVSRDIKVATVTTLGQSSRRRTGSRVSAGAARRDRTA